MANLWQLPLVPVTTPTETLVAGTIDFYDPGTTGDSNRKDVYLDSAETLVAANPYTLDSNATAELFGSGLYHIIVKNSEGDTVYDWDYIAIATITGSATPVSGSAVLWEGMTWQDIRLSGDITGDIQSVLDDAITDIGSGGTLEFPYAQMTAGGGVEYHTPLTIEGNGATIQQTGVSSLTPLLWMGGAVINGTPHPGYAGDIYTFSGALTAGDITFTVGESTSGLSVGDDVQLCVGQDPYDHGQHMLKYWTKVTVVAGFDVTVAQPLAEDVSGTFTPTFAFSPATHRLVKYTTPFIDYSVSNLSLIQDESIAVDSILYPYRTKNGRFSRIKVNGSLGMVVGDNSEITLDGYDAVTRVSGGSVGFGLTVFGTSNSQFRNLKILADGAAIYVENQCRDLLFEGATLIGSADKVTGDFIFVGGGSRGIKFKGTTIIMQTPGVSSVVYNDSGEAEEVVFEDTRLIGDILGFLTKGHRGYLEYKGVTYREKKTFRRKILLQPSLVNSDYTIPDGIYTNFKIKVDDKTDLTSITLNNSATSGFTIKAGATDYTPTAGEFDSLSVDDYVTVGSDYPFLDAGTRVIRFNTGASMPADTEVYLEIEYLQDPTDVQEYDDSVFYEEGTWTPANATVTVGVTTARYTRNGNTVHVDLDLTWPTTADGGVADLTGLPTAALGSSGAFVCGFTNAANPVYGVILSDTIKLYGAGGTPSTQYVNSDLSEKRIIASFTYKVA